MQTMTSFIVTCQKPAIFCLLILIKLYLALHVHIYILFLAEIVVITNCLFPQFFITYFVTYAVYMANQNFCVYVYIWSMVRHSYQFFD